MSFTELFLLAVGLSMDAFAVSICHGLTMHRVTFKKMVLPGLYFGAFQFMMPILGFLAATLFAQRIIAYDHWVAFALLSFLGGKMVVGGKRPSQEEEIPLTPSRMLPAALATSIDALAVGVSLAFLQVRIVPAASFIGVTTLVFSIAGVKIGSVFGARFKSKAEVLGGVILIAIGVKILLEHLDILVL